LVVVENEAVAIPGQNFHTVEALAEENEEVAIKGIELPGRTHDGDEAVVTAAEIDGLGREIDAYARGQRQHRRSASTRAAT
jgi:hypothetical protein